MKKTLLSLLLAGFCAPAVFGQESTLTTDTTLPPTEQPAGETPMASEPGFVSALDLQPVDPAPIDPPALTEPVPATGSPLDAAEAAPVVVDPNAKTARDFQDAEVAQVLRLLARQAKINMVVSAQVIGQLTMRLENTTAMEAIRVIITAQGLIMDDVEGVYYVKTQAEKASEPTESGSYTFSYARAENIAPLLASQLQSAVAPQVDNRTNTIFYKEVRSNLGGIGMFLESVDRATKQVMIEARLVEVNSNPTQSYGINWAGVVGGAATPQTFRYGGSPLEEDGTYNFETTNGNIQLQNLIGTSANPFTSAVTTGQAVANQFAILSIPQMSATMRFLNEDADAEFLANPRVVTADNQKATIKIIRSQPVPQLNFNEQTATAVFGGFEDKEFGNTLEVTPSINKDNYITLSVKPEISNKVRDETFIFQGAIVRSPVIDTRTLDSNVLIHSGDTLAIGGLLQDESIDGGVKVPVLGDIPILGYLFQEKTKSRTKRNLLVFVTPTIINQGEGTGLEDQVDGLHNSGEEYADPNGWRNNAKGAIRLVPTSGRQLFSDYPKPGIPVAPTKVQYKGSAPSRD